MGWKQIMDDSTVLGSTLRWVNQLRVKLGLEKIDHLPPGVQNDEHSCPIAIALEGMYNVNSDGIEANLDLMPDGSKPEWWIDLPPSARTFVERFDNGRYPELIDPGQYDNEPDRDAWYTHGN